MSVEQKVIDATPTARVINIKIEKEHWHTGEKYIVQPEQIPENTFKLRDHVSKLYSNMEIAYLAREKALGRYSRGNYSLFFQTLQDCFNRHYPFALRPEVLWYLIIHEVAQAVRLNPDRYRLYFSDSEEKQIVKIDVGLLVQNQWPLYIKFFSDGLKEKIPSAIGELFVPTFSTSTAETDAATTVAFMEAASPFYDYRLQLLCGLPLIRLDGTLADYAKLVEGAETLKTLFKKDLGLYFEHLIPVLKKIAGQAAGEPIDNDFWNSIYNHNSGSGGSDGSDDLGGWITTFINYVRLVRTDGDDYGKPPLLDVVAKPEEVYDWTQENRWMSVGMVPNHISSAGFVLENTTNGTKKDMKFIGGILGVENDNGFVSPQLSYGILESPVFKK